MFAKHSTPVNIKIQRVLRNILRQEMQNTEDKGYCFITQYSTTLY